MWHLLILIILRDGHFSPDVLHQIHHTLPKYSDKIVSYQRLFFDDKHRHSADCGAIGVRLQTVRIIFWR